MNFSFSSIMAGIIFGIIGFAMFKWGKKQSHFPTMLIGMLMLIYPYFVEGDLLPWTIGLALLGLGYFLKDR